MLDHELALGAGESQQHQSGLDRSPFRIFRGDYRLILVGPEHSINLLSGTTGPNLQLLPECPDRAILVCLPIVEELVLRRAQDRA